MKVLRNLLTIIVLILSNNAYTKDGDLVIKPSYKCNLERVQDVKFLDRELRKKENLESLSKIAYSSPQGTAEAGAYILIKNGEIEIVEAKNLAIEVVSELEDIVNGPEHVESARIILNTIINTYFITNGNTKCAPSNMNDNYWKESAEKFTKIRMELDDMNMTLLRNAAIELVPAVKSRYFMETLERDGNYSEIARLHTHNNLTEPSEIDKCLSRETGIDYLVLSYDLEKNPVKAKLYSVIKGKVKVVGEYDLKRN